jgi:hypothetical protein
MKAKAIHESDVNTEVQVKECKSCQQSLGFVIGATRLVSSMNSWVKREPISEQSTHRAYTQMLRLLRIADRSLEQISTCQYHKACITLPAKERGV